MEINVFLYIVLAMLSPSTGSMLTKVGRTILVVSFIVNNNGKIKVLKSAKGYVSWALTFLIYGIIGSFFAYSRTYATAYAVTLSYVVICNIALVWTIMNNKKLIKTAFYSVIWGATLKAGFCYTTNGFLCFLTSRSIENMSANTIGLYCAFATIVCWFIASDENKPMYKVLCLVNMVFMLLSASRKAILFIMIPLVIMKMAKSKDPLNILKEMIVVAVCAGIVLIVLLKVSFLYTLIGYRIEGMINGFLEVGEVDGSTNTRLGLIEDGLSWFRTKPIWGYGLSNFKALCAKYRPWGTVYYAHNNYVELLVDCGIVGTVLYYSLHIKLLWNGLLNWKRMDKEQLMLMGMLISMIICDYGMVTYFDIFSQLMLVLIYVSFSKLQYMKI